MRIVFAVVALLSFAQCVAAQNTTDLINPIDGTSDRMDITFPVPVIRFGVPFVFSYRLWQARTAVAALLAIRAAERDTVNVDLCDLNGLRVAALALSLPRLGSEHVQVTTMRSGLLILNPVFNKPVYVIRIQTYNGSEVSRTFTSNVTVSLSDEAAPSAASTTLTFRLIDNVQSYVLLHNPRGTLNRCDESSVAVENPQRLFDSQMDTIATSRGGYSISDAVPIVQVNDTEPNNVDAPMIFYEASQLTIQYSLLYGCGNGDKNKEDINNPETIGQCQVVVQLGCEDSLGQYDAEPNYSLSGGRPASYLPLESGTCTTTQPLSIECLPATRQANGLNDTVCDSLDLTFPDQRDQFNGLLCQCHPRKMKTYARHESETSYRKCLVRSANKNLVNEINTGDRKATTTVQNPNGTRYGFECPEERDYWPYWHPTGWRDIAVRTSQPSECPSLISQSENLVGRGECIGGSPGDISDAQAEFWAQNNPDSCSAHGGQWTVRDKLGGSAPECLLADKTAPVQSITWTLPTNFVPDNKDSLKCVLRIRYNVTDRLAMPETEDGQLWTARGNNDLPLAAVDDTNNTSPLVIQVPIQRRLATRVFEDRSEPFQIVRRTPNMIRRNIVNVNVCGKRGTAAQLQDAVPYAYVPQRVNVNLGDFIHFQWVGSSFNAPDLDGVGQQGTDRHNIVPVNRPDSSVPLVVSRVPPIFTPDNWQSLIWQNQNMSTCYSVAELQGIAKDSTPDDPRACHLLNAAPGYFQSLVLVEQTGVVNFMSSRGHRPGLQTQRGMIVAVTGTLTTLAMIEIGAGVLVGCLALGIAGTCCFKRYRRRMKFKKLAQVGSRAAPTATSAVPLTQASSTALPKPIPVLPSGIAFRQPAANLPNAKTENIEMTAKEESKSDEKESKNNQSNQMIIPITARRPSLILGPSPSRNIVTEENPDK